MKESLTRFGAANLHPEADRDLIAAADMAEVGSWVKGAERTGVRAVSITGSDPLAVFRSFVALTYITRVAEGR